jgi:hypothetical protein
MTNKARLRAEARTVEYVIHGQSVNALTDIKKAAERQLQRPESDVHHEDNAPLRRFQVALRRRV